MMNHMPTEPRRRPLTRAERERAADTLDATLDDPATPPASAVYRAYVAGASHGLRATDPPEPLSAPETPGQADE